jgi:hypothetical protein
MQQVDRITLTFEDNGRLHGDLVLRIGTEQWRGDSYFLWCEGPRSDADHIPIVQRVLSKLLDQWIATIRALRSKGTCFLPYDFSDPSTGWLRCTVDASDVLVIQRGWSEIEGWSISPSNLGEVLERLPDFKAQGPAITISREAMLRSLAGVP